MEQPKRNRLHYKRKWRSAKKNLLRDANVVEDINSSHSSDDDHRADTNPINENQPGCSHDYADRGKVDDTCNGDISDDGHSTESNTTREIQPGCSHDCDGVGEAVGVVGGDICEATNILSSDSPESENEICGSLGNELAEWANAFQVKHNAIDNLLKRLKHHGHQDLPSTARTLIKTPRNIQIDTKSDMEYYYFGVKEEIVKHFLSI